MKKFYSLPGLALAAIFLIVAFYFISESVNESRQFVEEKYKVMEVLNFNDRLLSLREWVFSEKAWQEKKVIFDVSVEKANEHYTQAKNYGYYLLFTCLGFLVINILIYAKRRIYFGLTFAFSFIALAVLVQGILNPILDIAAFKENMTIKVYVKPNDIPYFEEAVDYMAKIGELADYIEFVPVYGKSWAKGAKNLVGEGEKYLRENGDTEFGKDQVFKGRMYFYYQNKGIMDVISLLWNGGNKLVAIAIGTFSVVIPCIKLFMTLFILMMPVKGLVKIRKILSYISKWSMADVFVVGAFLSYLSFTNMSTGVDMEANVLYGLYYFGGYVIISIVLGTLLDKSINERNSVKKETINP